MPEQRSPAQTRTMATFTTRTRRVIADANRRARELHLDYLGDDQLFLALLAEPDGPAAEVLTAVGVDRAEAATRVHTLFPSTSPTTAEPSPEYLTLTTKATVVLDRSRTEAELLGDDGVGTEHLLLGMLRRADTAAAHVFGDLGVDAARIREQVAAITPSTDPADHPEPPPPFRPPAS